MSSAVQSEYFANINNGNGNDDHKEVAIDSDKEKPRVEQADATAETTTAADVKTSKWRVSWNRFVAIYWQNEFLFLVVIVLCLAKAYPPLGAKYLAPQITASWIAVIIIFFVAGLGIRTEAFHEAVMFVRVNAFVQCFNFGFVSGVVYGISRGVAALGLISQELADGVLITSCLSMSVNMVAILTRACNGDEAAAVFNQAFGNMVGVFLSPSLILGYLGVVPNINMGEIFFQLSMRIVVPVIVGQLLQKTSHYVSNLGTKHKSMFKHIQEYSLLYVIYCTFCKVFLKGSQSSMGQVLAVVLYQLLQLLLLMVIAWYLLGFLCKDNPELRVMGLFGCTHKTIAMGVPLISSIYNDSIHLGQYILPILIWHPMQLIVGTLLVPRLTNYIIKERERLRSADVDDISHDDNNNDDGKDDEEAQEEEARAPTPDNTASLVSDNGDEENIRT